jgi:ribosomal RNA-processing protein 8
MGCGDAVLGTSLTSSNKVYSFDLVSKNDNVIAADIANVPLQNNSVDIVVFCLSLMGSNISDFLTEAHR